jgi:hypothetical protein
MHGSTELNAGQWLEPVGELYAHTVTGRGIRPRLQRRVRTGISPVSLLRLEWAPSRCTLVEEYESVEEVCQVLWSRRQRRNHALLTGMSSVDKSGRRTRGNHEPITDFPSEAPLHGS